MADNGRNNANSLVTFHHPPTWRYCDRYCDSESDTNSIYSFSGTDSEYDYRIYPYHHHHRRPLVVHSTDLNVVRARPRQQQQPPPPRSYGYRRLHVQGGSSSSRREHHNCCQKRRGRSPRPCILKRWCRYIFGDPADKCYCGRCCRDGDKEGTSPTRHREEEYWGPGPQNWAYGPQSTGEGAWRDTPWSRGPGNNPYNLEPGGVVEEIEEGGTLPMPATAPVADQDVTHNHYHLGRRRSRRDSTRNKTSYRRDRNQQDGFLGLLDRERERDIERNMVDRQSALLRDNAMLSLLDRERERDRGGSDVVSLLGDELDRRRDLRVEVGRQMLKDREESTSEREGGLKAEIAALRRDMRKLLKAPSPTCRGKASRKSSSGRSQSSRGDRSSRGEIHFSHGEDDSDDGSEESAQDEEDAGGETEEDEPDQGGSDDDDDSAPSSGRGTSGPSVRRTGRSLRKSLSRHDGSKK